MDIRFNKEKLLSTIEDFYNATGINLSILDNNARLILTRDETFNDYCRHIQSTQTGYERCKQSDILLTQKCRQSKRTEYHICHAGLIDVVIPLMYGDSVLCYLFFGHIKHTEDFENIKEAISALPVDVNKIRDYYEELPAYDQRKIQSIANIAEIVSQHIILGDMLKPNMNHNVDQAITFINKNLESKLSIQDICKKINISKSVLYKNFRTHFGCTVNEYISSQRAQKSIHLLLNSEMSIENVALTVGFSSAAYYGKIFKKYYGITPLKYRNEKNLYNIKRNV